VSVLIALVIVAPLLLFLAHFPQSPDGAEMVHTALQGGVLHPSGMPLQSWINRAAVLIYPSDPGLALSVVSWIGALLTVALIAATLRRLGVRWLEVALACIAYAYVPVVATMSIVPEKYAWLSFTQMLFVYILVRLHSQKSPPMHEWWFLALALGLALAQHSANVILVPVFLYVLLRRLWVERKEPREALETSLACCILVGVVTMGFYFSLLLLRSDQVWPDWGHLTSAADVWNHMIRKDYGVLELFHQDLPGERISALMLLAKGMASWNLAFLFVFIGLFAMTRTRPGRFMGALFLLIILPGLGVLARTAMPAADFGTAMGYQERYPLLLWPLLAVLWGVGLGWTVQRIPRHGTWLLGGVALFLGLFVFESIQVQRQADNNLAEIYRKQAGYELDNFAIFWTGSDFTGFNGVTRAGKVVFPLKNLIGMDWYRLHVLPVLSPPVSRILAETKPGDKPALFRAALNEGFKVVLTEPTPFLEQPDVMALAEQTGVLWTFSSANNALYTKQLIANTLHLCTLLPNVWKGVPEDGMYFLREFLSSFRFAFLSAADYLQAQMELPPAQAARDVASSLVPGQSPAEWKIRCQAYAASMLAKPSRSQ
jgi:hypothetical protein